MPREKPQLVTLKLPRALAGRLRALARRNGKSQAELIREGVALRLETEAERSEGSVLDLIDDLVGTLEGPGDLATNPKRMRGFGK